MSTGKFFLKIKSYSFLNTRFFLMLYEKKGLKM